MHPMVLQGDEAQVQAHLFYFDFGRGANLKARYLHGLC
jgi:hypothetical protein